MNYSKAILLLFSFNVIDALMTIFWVRNDLAPEANHLMAVLLDWGVLPFLAVKLGMGIVTCGVLLYGSQYKLARVGVTVALIAYTGVIGSHILAGFAAYGYLT